MAHISTIEYPTRAALVAALVEFRNSDEVLAVDVVEQGRTLRITTEKPLEDNESKPRKSARGSRKKSEDDKVEEPETEQVPATDAEDIL